MRQRVGIMGGMFDPVHNGHLAAAHAACERLALNRLHLVPCAHPNHRQHATADAGHRLQMLRLVTADDARLLVDARELERPGVSYAVDTVQSLAAEQPQATLFFVLGWDSFASLLHWYRWQEILEMAHLCVVSRPAAASVLPAELSALLAARRCDERSAHLDDKAGAILLIDDVAVPVSSTAVRAALAHQRLPSAWLPDNVAAYIGRHRLYSEL